MSLSICIPTYNRYYELRNCLNSILIAYKEFKKIKLEICISDNSENKNNLKTINIYKKKFKNKVKINYFKFKKNKGVSINYLNCISMSKSEFVWTIGDDDMLTPDSLKIIYKLLKKKDIDYFFLNSLHLKDYKKDKKTLIDTRKLPKTLEPFSKIKKNKTTNFFDLINPNVTYDFLMAIYFSMFRKKNWDQYVNILDKEKIKDKRWISNFENSCFNIIVFASAFKNSNVFFQSKPLSINSSSSRDWKSIYCFLEIVRFPEMLDFYRKKGLGFFRYIYCKNFALRNFVNYHFKIYLDRKNNSGWEYVNIYKHIISNIIYPNAFLSIIYYLIRKIIKFKNN
tara:strand:- start:5592 stop:6608 length:1017 start_codon:yes stop_codon:yes gene_type:complete